MCSGGDDTTRQIEEQQRKRENLITRGLGSINQSFAGFDPTFYDRQRQAVLGAQLPQVGEQYRQQAKQLGYSLANQGLLHSTAGQNLGASLQKNLAQQEMNVGNQATQAVQGLQQQISQQKGSLISQLQQSADPTTAAQRAAESATQFSSPSLVQPLGNLFQNWANIYLTRQIANQYGTQQPINYSRTGFYPPNTPASAYVIK